MRKYDPNALTDSDSMPFGEYKDYLLGDVPADYLRWLLKQPWASKYPRLVEYANNIGEEGDDDEI